jgi:phospholipid-translocating ATPase
MREVMSALILCHNVTPTEDNGERVLQASSPDEIALVKFAEEIGYVLKLKEVNRVVIEDPSGKEEEFEILENFPFSSERKRMGILLRPKDSDHLIFYLKGADVVI